MSKTAPRGYSRCGTAAPALFTSNLSKHNTTMSLSPDDLSDGDEVYCILKSSESLSYYPEFSYRLPTKHRYIEREGKPNLLAVVTDRPCRGPEGVDTDRNASNLEPELERHDDVLFENKSEAYEGLVRKVELYSERLTQKLEELSELSSELRDNPEDINPFEFGKTL